MGGASPGGFGRTREPSSTTRHWPTWFELCSVGCISGLEPTMDYCFASTATRAGMVFLLRVPEREGWYRDSPELGFFWPLLTSTIAAFPTCSRVVGMIPSSRYRLCTANLLISITSSCRGIPEMTYNKASRRKCFPRCFPQRHFSVASLQT